MASRDPAEYNEASKKADLSGIDAVPDLVKECIAEHWDGIVPSHAQFISKVTKLACLSLVTLLKEGKLASLAGQSIDVVTGKQLAALVVNEVTSASNPLLVAQCCDIAFDLRVHGLSQKQIADQHRLGRASVSRICTLLKNTYTGQPGTGMKSNASTKKYAAIRRGRRAKPMPSDWTMRDRFTKAFHHERNKGTKRS